MAFHVEHVTKVSESESHDAFDKKYVSQILFIFPFGKYHFDIIDSMSNHAMWMNARSLRPTCTFIRNNLMKIYRLYV